VAGPYETELRSLLGEEGYRQYQSHFRASSGLGMLKELAGAVYRSDSPLTAAQGEQIAQVMIRETRSVPRAPGSKTVITVIDWDSVGLQARSVLMPTQLAVFQALLEARKLQERMNEMRRAASQSSAAKP
jgi:hypothetical protein